MTMMATITALTVTLTTQPSFQLESCTTGTSIQEQSVYQISATHAETCSLNTHTHTHTHKHHPPPPPPPPYSTPPPQVCRQCFILLSHLSSRPLLRVQEVNPLLYIHIQELGEVEALRRDILQMKRYLVECPMALELQLLHKVLCK